ncbi:UDP-N-acetylmuramoyl-L-alanyl-D-glutamate--2,6-diaminopimelate ligase [Thioflexithrix psekupsensis]|uniref:UDP-N-acetylmuramoyl-L-alanyl-D-glutamate--2,6-diaminopimelate ligase n=2 Tax=Thioflexithrix psekupsensis TaxID=1570016 RepID=A0A251X5S2_9GAMM|nr:UDP-N-acetylmuramoyl-L-alanyl-D-glutamate--2,6-diaminopimelate ligase [Thioflexithrix psekupsensis]
MQLSQVLHHLHYPCPEHYDRTLHGLALDSRLVHSCFLFLACRGTHLHGKNFIDLAVKQQAAAILCDADNNEFSYTFIDGKVPCFYVPHLTQHVGDLASFFFNYPSRELNVIGITGTNGKTSVSHFVAQLLNQRYRCALIGTLGYGYYGQSLQPSLTTPDPVTLQAFFARCRAENVHHLVMEVSSHALDQGRVQGVNFKTAVLTNVTQDHLDYHGNMENYIQAKQKLFQFDSLHYAVLNADDEISTRFQTQLSKNVRTLYYGLRNPKAELHAHLLGQDARGYRLRIRSPWGVGEIYCHLYGHFNINNLLAAAGCLLLEGFNFDNLLKNLSQIKPVIGRMEQFKSTQHSELPTVIVDYAHTPDALSKTLTALKERCQGQLWCVFGCGGNRDKSKRPLMGQAAKLIADNIIITDDNPRHESSEAIIADILTAWSKQEPLPMVIPQREEAITYAIHSAAANDLILIAGKGHETYQIIGDIHHPFSDRALIQKLLEIPTHSEF